MSEIIDDGGPKGIDETAQRIFALFLGTTLAITAVGFAMRPQQPKGIAEFIETQSKLNKAQAEFDLTVTKTLLGRP